MATVYDVAEKAGVSIATVSRVFNNNTVSQSAREKVTAAARSLGYTPNLAARSLMTKRTDTIGVVLPDMHGEFFSELVRGIDAGARRLGLHMLVSCSHDELNEMAAVLSAMQGRVDGVIILSPLIAIDALEPHIPPPLPAVIVNGSGGRGLYPEVNLDNRAGARQMMAHLLAEGHRDICIVSGPSDNLDAEQRQLGCVEAADHSDCRLRTLAGAFTEASGYAAGVELLAHNALPDAVFALNDAMAIGCLCALAERGIAVPGQIALAGFDDIPLAQYLRPSLTTVHVPIADLGSRSLQRLLAILRPGAGAATACDVLVPELVIRDSSRRACDSALR